LLPVDALLVAACAIQSYLRDLRETDDCPPLGGRAMAFSEFNELIGVTAQLDLADRYTTGG
jgi:hypothetical protein